MVWQPNRLEAERLEKAQALEARGIELYPRRSHPTHTTAQAVAEFEAAEVSDSEVAESVEVTVAGRIRRLNIKGKISFMHIEDERGRVQLMLRVDELGEPTYELIRDKLIEV